MIGYLIFITACIVTCASLVPICQYVHHANKTHTPVYQFSTSLFDVHIKTPINHDMDKKIAQERSIPLP